MSFNLQWPWIGVALAVVLLASLFFTRLFRSAGVASRWHDPSWLAVFGLVLYIVHQFEEHGIDLQGARYAFRGEMCRVMGYAHAVSCPIPESFITAVNVGSVWGACVFAWVLGRHRPVVALSAYGIALVNALTHIVPALWEHAYNPGLVTAIVLFLPAGLWALRVGMRAGIGGRGVFAIIVGGVLTHAVLMGSLLAYLHGWIAAPMLVAIQLANMGAPLAAVLVLCRPRSWPGLRQRREYRDRDSPPI